MNRECLGQATFLQQTIHGSPFKRLVTSHQINHETDDIDVEATILVILLAARWDLAFLDLLGWRPATAWSRSLGLAWFQGRSAGSRRVLGPSLIVVHGGYERHWGLRVVPRPCRRP